jgi:MFS family permease
VLNAPRVRRIVVANTVNRLGNWIGIVAVLVATFDHTHNALAIAAVIFAWQALPAALVPPLVARVEASRRRRELSALYVFEAVATGALVVLVWKFSLPAVLVIATVDGTAALAASALLRAEAARAAREELAGIGDDEARHEAERDVNAALNVGYSLTFVLGPAIGGAIVAAAGSPAALIVDVVSFLICAALLTDLHPHVEEAAGDSVRARLRAAWTHVNSAPALRGILAAEALALIFFETGAPIEITYVKATLHAGDRGVGLVLTIWGVGAVLGSAVFARMRKRSLAVSISVGTVAIGSGYVGFALAPTLALACVAALVGGIGNGMQYPSLISIVQRLTPQPLHGRLMGATESLAALCRAIGLPLGGAIAAISSPRIAFAIVGSAAVATTVALLRASPPGLLSDSNGQRRANASQSNSDDLRVAVPDPSLPGTPAHE